MTVGGVRRFEPGEREERPICGAEPDGLRSGVKHARVCWLDKGHDGEHRNRGGETWENKVPVRRVPERAVRW